MQNGYDTHSGQNIQHRELLGNLSDSIKAFLDDLRADHLSKDVAVVTFSEFGRRVAENDSRGTDHGAAGPMLIAGDGIRGGLHGAAPDLAKLVDGDIQFTTDFRAVYATLLEALDENADARSTRRPIYAARIVHLKSRACVQACHLHIFHVPSNAHSALPRLWKCHSEPE